MAKPNVQIRRIWTFATGLLNLLRRPSFFFPTHKWGSCFCRPIYGQDFFPEPYMARRKKPSGLRSPIGAPRFLIRSEIGKKISKNTCEKNGFSSDFDTFSSSDISPDSGSPQIHGPPRESIHEIRAAGRESEETAVLPIPKESERKARFYSLCPAGAEEKKTRVREKPVLFLKEKGPSSAVENRRGPRSEIGGPCDFRRQTRVPRKFMEFSGDSGIEKNSPFF